MSLEESDGEKYGERSSEVTEIDEEQKELRWWKGDIKGSLEKEERREEKHQKWWEGKGDNPHSNSSEKPDFSKAIDKQDIDTKESTDSRKKLGRWWERESKSSSDEKFEEKKKLKEKIDIERSENNISKHKEIHSLNKTATQERIVGKKGLIVEDGELKLVKGKNKRTVERDEVLRIPRIGETLFSRIRKHASNGKLPLETASLKKIKRIAKFKAEKIIKFLVEDPENIKVKLPKDTMRKTNSFLSLLPIIKETRETGVFRIDNEAYRKFYKNQNEVIRNKIKEAVGNAHHRLIQDDIEGIEKKKIRALADTLDLSIRELEHANLFKGFPIPVPHKYEKKVNMIHLDEVAGNVHKVTLNGDKFNIFSLDQIYHGMKLFFKKRDIRKFIKEEYGRMTIATLKKIAHRFDGNLRSLEKLDLFKNFPLQKEEIGVKEIKNPYLDKPTVDMLKEVSETFEENLGFLMPVAKEKAMKNVPSLPRSLLPHMYNLDERFYDIEHYKFKYIPFQRFLDIAEHLSLSPSELTSMLIDRKRLKHFVEDAWTLWFAEAVREKRTLADLTEKDWGKWGNQVLKKLSEYENLEKSRNPLKQGVKDITKETVSPKDLLYLDQEGKIRLKHRVFYFNPEKLRTYWHKCSKIKIPSRSDNFGKLRIGVKGEVVYSYVVQLWNKELEKASIRSNHLLRMVKRLAMSTDPRFVARELDKMEKADIFRNSPYNKKNLFKDNSDQFPEKRGEYTIQARKMIPPI